MTTIVSAPTIVTLSTPGASSLSSLAPSMSAGSWAQLTVPNQVSSLGANSANPNDGQSCNFANSMPWSSSTKCMEMMIADHFGTGNAMQYTRYIESANAFQIVLMPGSTGVGGIGHGYDHTAVNPATGDIYHHKYNSAATYRKRPADSAFSLVSNDPASHQVAESTCFWSGSFAGAGAQGAWMVFATGACNGSASDGEIVALDPLTGSWFFHGTSMAPFYGSGATYHSVMEYSAKKNVAVYGGGNAAPNKAWRLNADRTVTTMPSVPTGMMGIKNGNLNCDPVTGNFLLLSARQLWELNPDGAGKWTQQTGSRTPPSGVGIPSDTNTGVISCAVPDYGVVAYITMTSPSSGTFYLYKHA